MSDEGRARGTLRKLGLAEAHDFSGCTKFEWPTDVKELGKMQDAKIKLEEFNTMQQKYKVLTAIQLTFDNGTQSPLLGTIKSIFTGEKEEVELVEKSLKQ